MRKKTKKTIITLTAMKINSAFHPPWRKTTANAVAMGTAMGAPHPSAAI